MKLAHIALVVALSAVTAFAVVKAMGPSQSEVPIKETRLDQIKRTGVLRCGYSIWPPALMRDPNTGAFSGVFYELMEEIGKQLNISIEWTTEVSPAHMFADLDNNRYDMVCSSFIATPARAKVSAFTIPVFYNALYLFSKSDDTRFDNNYEAANNKEIQFAAIEGGISAIQANQKFPLAKTLSLADMTTPADTFLYVLNGKADLVISEPLSFALFVKNNQGKLKRVEGAPLSISAGSMPLPQKEYDLQNTINATLTHLHSMGFIDRILTRYETENVKTMRPTKPYVIAP